MTHPLPLSYQGCWAERLVAPAHLVAEKPRNASWAEAAAFPVPALTAEQVVSEALAVQPGETILVNGAGGVTGGMIVELAAISGARVIATASESSAGRGRRRGLSRPRVDQPGKGRRRIVRHSGCRERCRWRGGRCAEHAGRRR